MASDPLDQAADLTQQLHDNALANHKAEQVKRRLPPTGFCYYCSEPVQASDTYCDVDCHDDHEYEEKRRQANGA